MSEGALEGSVAIVTGAAGGIGREVARAMAAAGAAVTLADLDVGRLETLVAGDGFAGAEVATVEVDVGDPASVAAMRDAVLAERGRIDVLVNNAGIGTAVPFAELSDEAWAEMLRVNLTGVFLCTRAVFPTMVAQGRGRIISIGSNLALKGGVDLAHYCAAKAGVHGLMRAVALEGAPHGVTANVVAPGPVDTELLHSLPDEWLREKLDELPLGRFAKPSEIAPSVVLLASDGGAYYTGATLNVSGGDVIL